MAELISERYGNALFDAALEGGCIDEISNQLAVFKNAFLSAPEYLKILSAPVIEPTKKSDMINLLCQNGCHSFLKNFLLILVRNNRFSMFFQICKEFFELYDKHNNIVRVKAITAIELSDELKSRLQAKLEVSLKKTVIIENIIDKAVIGGVKLQYENSEVDASVGFGLGALRHQIKEGAKG